MNTQTTCERCGKTVGCSEWDIHTCTPPAAPVQEPAGITKEQAHDMGKNGAKPTEAERLLFEAWMRGHCWKVTGKWTGETYVHEDEHSGFVHPHAMNTRQLWAAWRDRAALATPPAAQPRTDQQIVDQTEELAVWLLSWCFNHQPETDTPMRESTHPFAERCWAAACHIQEMLTATDPENAVSELDVAPEKGGAA
jgi:hypothetical protein